MDYIQSERRPKEDVNYRLHEQCSSCSHYFERQCEIVNGQISPDAVCNEWKLIESVAGTTADFFVQQYKETKPPEKK